MSHNQDIPAISPVCSILHQGNLDVCNLPQAYMQLQQRGLETLQQELLLGLSNTQGGQQHWTVTYLDCEGVPLPCSTEGFIHRG